MALYALRVEAKASHVEGFVPGQRHALLVFLMAVDRDVVSTHLSDCLQENGWLEAQISGMKELGLDATLIDDNTLREAARTAIQEGYSIVVYRDPLTS